MTPPIALALVPQVAPGWVVPSMLVLSPVIFGRVLASVIVCGPAPGMLKMIVSAPGFALASLIARLSVPASEVSTVDVTV